MSSAIEHNRTKRREKETRREWRGKGKGGEGRDNRRGEERGGMESKGEEREEKEKRGKEREGEEGMIGGDWRGGEDIYSYLDETK